MWNTTLFARRGGRWRIVQSQGTMLQRAPAAVPVAAARLDAYAGRYGRPGVATTLVARDGAGLVARAASGTIPPRVLVPVSDASFVDKVGTRYVFERGPDARVARLVMRWQDEPVIARDRLP